MHSVTSPTAIAQGKSRLTSDVPRQPQRRHRDKIARTDRTINQLREALARADQPVRARVLALDLGLPSAEVTAGLRRLQDVGAAVSHARRWAAVDPDAATSPSTPAGPELP